MFDRIGQVSHVAPILKLVLARYGISVNEEDVGFVSALMSRIKSREVELSSGLDDLMEIHKEGLVDQRTLKREFIISSDREIIVNRLRSILNADTELRTEFCSWLKKNSKKANDRSFRLLILDLAKLGEEFPAPSLFS